ncbi:MAG: phosphatidate cytidylyltransferase [Candidatus Adiutrix sp.]|jgi:phosphatidate cytidylyltransferase|nr:phosphatidate cytidylyltransferase [Candidatus Adiutrix sp.]
MNLEKIKQKALSRQGSRWLVALVLLAIVIPSIFSDQYLYFYLVILLTGGVTWWEFSTCLLGRERTGLLALALFGWLAVASGAFYLGPTGQSLGLVAALGLGAGYCLWALERESGAVLLNLLGRLALGHLYLSFLLSFFLMLIKVDSGSSWLMYVLLVTAAADTAAFFAGARFKGPKLAPKISPNKTISGLAGGVAASVVVSAVFSFILPNASLGWLSLFGLFLGLWGAVGDLFESALKRAVEVKDSSSLLLGHGGFLDRLDSLLFNGVLVYGLVVFLADYCA